MLDACVPRLPIVLRGASVFQGPTQMTRADNGVKRILPCRGLNFKSQPTAKDARFLS